VSYFLVFAHQTQFDTTAGIAVAKLSKSHFLWLPTWTARLLRQWTGVSGGKMVTVCTDLTAKHKMALFDLRAHAHTAGEIGNVLGLELEANHMG